MGTAITYFVSSQQTRKPKYPEKKNKEISFSFDDKKQLQEDYGEEIEVI